MQSYKHIHICAWINKNNILYPQLKNISLQRSFPHLQSFTFPDILTQVIKALSKQAKRILSIKDCKLIIPNFGYFYPKYSHQFKNQKSKIVTSISSIKQEKRQISFSLDKVLNSSIKTVKAKGQNELQLDQQMINFEEIAGRLFISASTVQKIIKNYFRAAFDLIHNKNGQSLSLCFPFCNLIFKDRKLYIQEKQLRLKIEKDIKQMHIQNKYKKIWKQSIKGSLLNSLNFQQVQNHLNNGVQVTKKYINSNI